MPDAIRLGESLKLIAGERRSIVRHNQLGYAMSSENGTENRDGGFRVGLFCNPDVQPLRVGVCHDQKHESIDRASVIDVKA